MSAADDLLPLKQPAPEWFRAAFEVPRVEGHADCGGVPIHYFRWGDPERPGIVLTHGFMAHARCWAWIAPLLAADYCLVAFDLSGMGDSGWRDAYTVDDRAAETVAVAEHAGLTTGGRRPALVCHSYGGSVGMCAAEQWPDFWSALVVVDMSMIAPGETPDFEEVRKRREARGIRPHRVAPDLAAAYERFRLAPDQPCENEWLMEYMAWHSLRQVEGGWVWKFDPQIMSMDDHRSPDWWQSLAGRFAALPMPRGIIHGQHSTMFQPGAAQHIRSVSDARIPMVEVPGAWHHIMMDQPVALASTVDAMLQGLGAGSA